MSTDLGRRALAWVLDRWQLLAALVAALVAVAAFVAAVRSDATAGAALAPRVERIEQRLVTIEAVMPLILRDVQDVRAYLLGPRHPAPLPIPKDVTP